MRHFAIQSVARLMLYASFARCAWACGADGDHGPPTGPIGPIIIEGGASSGGAATGGAAPNGMSGDSAFNVAGARFGAGGDGSAGRELFGTGGSGTGQFSRAGTPNAFGGQP